MRLEKYLGKEAEELNRVIKEIDDLQKEENVVHKERKGKRKWKRSDAEQFPTKFYVGLVIIQAIIVCYFLINHPVYFFQTFLVCFITTLIVSIFTAIGYPIFMKSMYEGETKRLEGLEKREKEIESKLRSLYNLKEELEFKIINNKANADLEKLSYDKEKYEDILKPEVLKYLDVLVDGQYIDSKRDPRLKWCGSTNQRVIDVFKSLKENKIVILEE